MRLIDADALKRKICGEHCGCEPDECGGDKPCEMGIFIDDAPSADRWIPVTEGLPDEDIDVLAYDGGDIFVAWHFAGWNSTDHRYDPYTPVIAWQPLPKPYEGVTE